MRSRERFRYYNNDFETCKVLKLRNCGNNGSKLEQCWKSLTHFFEFWVIFRNMSITLGIVSTNWLIFGQELGISGKIWVFFDKNWVFFARNCVF